MPVPTIRPVEPRDVDAVHAVSVSAFDDLGRRLGLEDNPPSPLAAARVRIGRVLATDPGGAWVAEDAGLDVRFDIGAVFLAGDVGPFAPYLPSGAYL
jgi:hypothetical protein